MTVLNFILIFFMFVVIVTEKTNILLRYLHQQYEKKAVKQGTKREGASGSADEEAVQRKRPRFDWYFAWDTNFIYD